MRRTLFALLAAMLPVAASAAPFAYYNPANGDVVFHELYDGYTLRLRSKEGQLNPSIASLPIELLPASFTPPDAQVSTHLDSAAWLYTPRSPRSYFQFHTLAVRGAVKLHTPPDDLYFMLDTRFKVIPDSGKLIAVPEPSTLVLAASSLLGLSLRCRRHPHAANGISESRRWSRGANRSKKGGVRNRISLLPGYSITRYSLATDCADFC